MSATGSDLWSPLSAAAYDHDAERLLGAIAFACDPRASFAEQVEAGLSATLSLFATNPDLTRRLALPPFGGDDEVMRCRHRWLRRYGAMLHRAAAVQPEAGAHPPFLEPTLLGGIATLISREVISGRGEQLDDLLPTLLEFLLVYYVGLQEAGSRARAVRARTFRPQ